MMKKRGFTLVEILVVVSIIAMVIALTIPSIKAIQTSSARAEAYNTINAALQGVRSYAIMNQVKTAARFQPNGKVVFLYRYENTNSSSSYLPLGAGAGGTYPHSQTGGAGTGRPNDDGYIYLPVMDQEPLKMPSGYAASALVANTVGIAPPGTTGLAPLFYEPFYVCYNSDGTLAVDEPIWVAMVDYASTTPTMHAPEPIDPHFSTGAAQYAWDHDSSKFPQSYSLSSWLNFTQGKDEVTTIEGVDDRKLTRYYYVARTDGEVQTIFEKDEEIGIDHYAGKYNTATAIERTLSVNSVSSFAIFKTPENWSIWPLYDTDDAVQTKTKYVQDELTMMNKASTFVVNPDLYETVFINRYTGRLIRANQ